MISKIVREDGTTELTNIKSTTFTEKVNADTDIMPGCVASAYIQVEAFGNRSDAPLAGEALKYYQVDSEQNETLIGTFYAEPSVPSKSTYSFVAYDAVSKLDVDFSGWLVDNQENFPMTMYDIVSAACTIAGVELGSSSWPLSTQTVKAFYSDGLTCRNILQYAAEIACRFVRCNSTGQVVFDWYTNASGYRIYPTLGANESETFVAYKESGLTYVNYETDALSRVAVHPGGEEQVAYIYPANVESGNTLHVQNNLLLTDAESSVMSGVAQNIYETISALGQYRPCSAKLFPNENPLRAGQIVPVTDIQGVSFRTILTGLSVDDATAQVESTGNKEYSSYTAYQEKAIAQLASDIVRIKRLKVDWADINTAVVSALVADGINADDITVSGTLHSSDYVRASGAIYADSGFGIELDTKRLSTPYFALTPSGWMYARRGQIAGFNLNFDNISAILAHPVEYYEKDGTPYTPVPTVDLQHPEFTAPVSGTVVYTRPATYNGETIYSVWARIKNVGGRSEEDWPLTARIRLLDENGTEVSVKTWDTIRYMPETSTFGRLYTFTTEDLSGVATVRVEIDLVAGDTCYGSYRYGNYNALYYGDSNKLRGNPNGIYIGNDGISVGEDVVLTPDGHMAANVISGESADIDNLRLNTYRSLTDIGLTSGSATIDAAYVNLPKNSIGLFNAGEFAAGECPSDTGYGMVQIFKLAGSWKGALWYRSAYNATDYRMHIKGTEETSGTYQGYYLPTGTWVKIDNEGYANRFGTDYSLNLNTVPSYHICLLETDGSTLNTPYAAGLSSWTMGAVISYCTSASYGTQVYFSRAAREVFIRRLYEGAWSAWVKIPTENDLAPSSVTVTDVNVYGRNLQVNRIGRLVTVSGWVRPKAQAYAAVSTALVKLGTAPTERTFFVGSGNGTTYGMELTAAGNIVFNSSSPTFSGNPYIYMNFTYITA